MKHILVIRVINNNLNIATSFIERHEPKKVIEGFKEGMKRRPKIIAKSLSRVHPMSSEFCYDSEETQKRFENHG